MSAQNPPVFLQAGSHPAEDVRRFIDAAMGVLHGIVEAGDLAVSQNGTPNMSVNVAGGRAFIKGTEATYQGSYFVENRGTLNLAISAADPTNPRRDLVVAKVQDAGYSGVTNAWSLAVVTGTPAPSPSDPAAPANSIVLARVTVAALATSITNANITDLRTAQSGQSRATALGGTIVCSSSTRPAHSEGRLIYETDTDRLLVSDGSAWVRVAHAAVAGRTGCRLRRNANQSVNNTTATSILWDTEDQDTDGFITTTSATVTIPAGLGGLYAITAHMVCAISEAGGVRDFISIEVTSALTGMPVNFRNAGEAAAEDMMDISVTIPLAAGDSFVVQVFHSTGAAVNFTGWLSCYRVGV